MIAGLLLGCVAFSAAMIFAVAGCGETNEDRRRISRHIDALGAKIKADPESDESQQALAELIRIVNGNWSFARSRACWKLGDLGSLASPTIPTLIRAAESDDPYVEEAAVRALGNMGSAAGPAVELLMAKVEKGVQGQCSRGVIWYAAEALGSIGEPALKAIPLLRRAATSENERLARHAPKALAELTSIQSQPERE